MNEKIPMSPDHEVTKEELEDWERYPESKRFMKVIKTLQSRLSGIEDHLKKYGTLTKDRMPVASIDHSVESRYEFDLIKRMEELSMRLPRN